MNDEKTTLVPRLRFPEFREAGEWEEKPLSMCCHLQAGKFVRASDIQETASTDIYPCYGGNGLRGYTQTFTHSGRYPLIGRQGAQCGNVNLANGKFHATEHAVVATANQEVNTVWLFYNLLKMNLNQHATGQAQPGLSVENLDKLIVRIPEDEKEQQKIADCLSSLDALIAAQADKLDTLKTHKKGLMQQLFPHEGETVPRLRFPGFRGNWKLKPLVSLTPADKKYGIVDGPFGSNLKTIHYKKEGIPIISSGFVTEGVFNPTEYLYVDEEKFKQEKRSSVCSGDIVMAKIGARCGASAIMPKEHPTGILSGNALKITVDSSRFSTEFVWQRLWSLYDSGRLHSLRAEGAQPAISIANLKKYLIEVPEKEEQELIGACLTSLEDLIAANKDKLDALKTHKKGLMQQLFLSPEA